MNQTSEDDEPISDKNVNHWHMAGIIPIAMSPLDFKMPWNDALMPIAKNTCAIERNVCECAFAGCETIWIICNSETIPLVRKIIR